MKNWTISMTLCFFSVINMICLLMTKGPINAESIENLEGFVIATVCSMIISGVISAWHCVLAQFNYT
jgi:hypothetical protein